MRPVNYRADIDGLRAWAVIFVMLFHLDIAMFKGGFIGVDVFFVISGFLITRLIRNEVIENKSFSFSNFYVRRARRLFPSLFFTLCLCFLLSYILFAPQHFKRLGGSLLHAAVSMGNFYFWSETGYFNAASELKPLLHTWSLSIEEQFYLVWPIVLVLFLKKAPKYTTPVIIVILGFFSLYLNQIFVSGSNALIDLCPASMARLFSDGPSTIFFLSPFRVFEFSLGAIVIWLERFKPGNKAILEPLVLIGLGMIIYPVLTYSEDIIFPSYNALLPCIGTALLIYSGTAKYCGKLLSNSLIVKIGLISYSLYLIHWPLIVFYKYWKISELLIIEKILIFAISLAAAVVMYRFIEQPFRRGSSSKALSHGGFGFTCAMLAVVLMFSAANVWANNGWPWRFPGELAKQLNWKGNQFHEYVWNRLNKFKKDFVNNGQPKILVIGDSMAADFINILAESNNIGKFDLVTLPVNNLCKSVFPVSKEIYQKFLPKKVNACTIQQKAIMESPLLKQADTVVLACEWSDWSIDLIGSTVKFLKDKGVSQVAVVGNKTLSMSGVNFLAKYSLRKTIHKIRTPVTKMTKRLNKKIKGLNSDFLFINLLDAFCNETGCTRTSNNGYLIIYDYSHLTPYGARYIGHKVTRSEWMNSLANARKGVDNTHGKIKNPQRDIVCNYAYYLPVFKPKPNYWSGLGIKNLSSTNCADVVVIVYNQEGIIQATETRTIAKNGQASFLIGTELSNDGWIKIGSNQKLAGLNFLGQYKGSKGNYYVANVSFVETLSTSLIFPHVAQNNNWDTIICSANPNNTMAAATLTYIDKNGKASAPHFITIPPNGSVETPVSIIANSTSIKGGSLTISSANGLIAIAIYNNLKTGNYSYTGINAVAF